ncbi:hypothetical protein KIN20_023756 [Parelaphostrongylus tenuis]|uniref:Uncharacterized protein n=1 Tax=Parelaphostrongylus tenuis TaxID=148309 RepID=A0AAD5MSH3_PARTN|nr:hypothetical protein KIN20_023756 [Parelaphostrongylus tenuis]
MVNSSPLDVRVRVPGVAQGEREAMAFVQRIVMQTVADVFQSQARSALSPIAVILSILGQLTHKCCSRQFVIVQRRWLSALLQAKLSGSLISALD